MEADSEVDTVWMVMQCPTCSQRFTGESTVCQSCGAELVAAVPELVGTNLEGRYEIVSLLSSTEDSEIYKGRHLLLDQLVAIKILKADIKDDERALKDFIQDARNLSAPDKQQTTRVLDFGVTAQGRPYLVLKHTEDLRQLRESGNIRLRLSSSGAAVRKMKVIGNRRLSTCAFFVVLLLVLAGAAAFWVNSDSWRVFMLDIARGGDLEPQSRNPALMPELKRNAQLYMRAGRFEVSEMIYKHLDEIAATTYGNDSPERQAAQEDLACAAEMAGHKESARAIYDQLMKSLAARGWDALQQKKFYEGTSLLRHAEEIARAQGNTTAYAYILHFEGMGMMRQSKWKEADEIYRRRLKVLLAAGYKNELPMQYSALATVNMQLHQPDLALSCADKAMKLLNENELLSNQIRILVASTCGSIYSTLGKKNEAIDGLNEAIKIADDSGTYTNDELPGTFELLAQIYINDHHPDKAVKLLRDRMTFLEEANRRQKRNLIGLYSAYAIAQDLCARAGKGKGSFDLARLYYQKAAGEARAAIAAGDPSRAEITRSLQALEAAEGRLPCSAGMQPANSHERR